MKHFIYALPLALFATAAAAQTDTTTTTTGTDTMTGAGATGEMFGTSWPLSVGTTFLTDDESGMVRPQEELSSGWQSLSQTDRDLVKADCKMFMEEHGGDSADAGAATTGSADASTTTSGGADTSASGNASTTTTGSADTSTSGDASTTATGDASTTTTGSADTSGSADAGATATGDASGGSAVVPAGYTQAEMLSICKAVEGL